MLKKINIFLGQFLLIATYTSTLEAIEIFHIPILQGYENNPILVQASIGNNNDFLWAKLYFKKKTDSLFTSTPMLGNGNRFYASIPETFSVKEGIQYYIEVYTQNKERITLPKLDESYYSIYIEPTNYTDNKYLKVIEPKPNDVIKNNQFKVIGTIQNHQRLSEEGVLTVRLDDSIVPIKQIGTFFKWIPKESIGIGKHTLVIEFSTANKQIIDTDEIGFEIVKNIDSTPLEELDSHWKNTGTTSLEYQYSKNVTSTSNGSVLLPHLYTTSLEWKSEKKDTIIYLGPFLYSSRKSEYGYRTNKFTLGIQNSYFSIKGGSISSSFTDISGSNIPYWGIEIIGTNKGEALYKKYPTMWGVTTKSFIGQTKNSVEATNMVPGIFTQKSYGTLLKLEPIKNIGLSIQYINIEDSIGSITNGFNTPLIYNKTYSISFIINNLNTKYLEKIELEAGGSSTQITQFQNKQPNVLGWGASSKINGGFSLLSTKWNLSTVIFSPNFYSIFGTQYSDITKTSLKLKEEIFKNKISLDQEVFISLDNLKNQKKYRTHIQHLQIGFNLHFDKLPSVVILNQLQYQKANYIFERFNNTFTITVSKTIPFKKHLIGNTVSFSQNNQIENLFNISLQKSKITTRTYNISIKPNIYIHETISIGSHISYNLYENINTATAISHSLIQSLDITLSLVQSKIKIPIYVDINERLEHKSNWNTAILLKYLAITGNIKLELLLHKNHKGSILFSYAITANTIEHTISYQNLLIGGKYEASF